MIHKLLFALSLACISGQLGADPLANQTYQNQTKIRQLEIDQRMGQIQQDMTSQSQAIQSSISSGTTRTYNPASLSSLNTGTVPPTYNRPNVDLRKDFLEKLGNPEKETGIYAYPASERLYHYGLMLIELGFTDEGIRAITEHTRIQAESAAAK